MLGALHTLVYLILPPALRAAASTVQMGKEAQQSIEASQGHTGSGNQTLITLAPKAKFFGPVFAAKGH